jgi:predicted SprT family Zn-dependent metalloprotease
MGRGFASVNYDSVCKCKKPRIVVQGYSGKMKRQPIYYCYNCHHQFKSNSKKWEELANKIKKTF